MGYAKEQHGKPVEPKDSITGSRSAIHPGLGLLARMREMREAAELLA